MATVSIKNSIKIVNSWKALPVFTELVKTWKLLLLFAQIVNSWKVLPLFTKNFNEIVDSRDTLPVFYEGLY